MNRRELLAGTAGLAGLATLPPRFARAAPLATWHHLAIIVPRTDIDGIAHTMTNDQRADAEARIAAWPDQAFLLSDGMWRVKQTVYVIQGVARAKSHGGCFESCWTIGWGNAGCMRDLLEAEGVDHLPFDTVSAHVANESLNSGASGGGLTNVQRDHNLGLSGGFSVNILPKDTGNYRNTGPNIMPHEIFAHQVEAHFERFHPDLGHQPESHRNGDYRTFSTQRVYDSAHYREGPWLGFTFNREHAIKDLALNSDPTTPVGIGPEGWRTAPPREHLRDDPTPDPTPEPPPPTPEPTPEPTPIPGPPPMPDPTPKPEIPRRCRRRPWLPSCRRFRPDDDDEDGNAPDDETPDDDDDRGGRRTKKRRRA